MTLLALPKPGPPYAEPSDDFAEASCSWKRLARLTPSRAEPPTRSRSRRVMPSHVSRPGCPGITSMVCHLSAVLQPWQIEKLTPWERGGEGGRHESAAYGRRISFTSFTRIGGERQSVGSAFFRRHLSC